MVDIDKFICDLFRSIDMEEFYCKTVFGKAFNVTGAIKWTLRQQGIIYKDGQLQRIEGSEYWTIEDAKPGDVLADDRAILLFRSIGNRNWKNVISYYAILETNLNNRFSISGNEEYWGKIEDCELKPASKEQRDLLFQKMTEAGYEWDADKKELKKIEQKPVEWHREDEQNLNACLGFIPDAYLCRWLTDIIHTKYDKPAWSEEDEHRIKDIVYFLDTAKKHYASTVELDACISWLKSLRPQSTWKPSDEQMDALEEAIRYGEEELIGILSLLYNDLKKLK